MSLIVGSNSNYYSDLKADVPKVTGRRVYYDSVAQGGVVPTVWPSSFSGDQVVLSIRPRMFQSDTTNQGPWLINNGWSWTNRSWTLNPAGVNPIKQLIASAASQPNQDLTIWHEAGNFYTKQQQPWMFDNNAMKVAHAVMQGLCSGTNVSYGIIMCMPPSQMAPWLIGNADWYGLDIYDWHTSGSACSGAGDFRYSNGSLNLGLLTNRLASWQSTIQGITGKKYPKLNVCETNSPCPNHQGKWFTAVGDWLNGHGGHRMLTYWSTSGSASTDWSQRGGDVVGSLTALTNL